MSQDWWKLLHEQLEIQPPTSSSLCNISLCYFKLEEYESSLEYADQAVQLDPTWNCGKPLFRRASAFAALLRFSSAVADIEKLLATTSSNLSSSDLAFFQAKLAEWKKAFFQANFAKALSVPKLELSEAGISKVPESDLAIFQDQPSIEDPEAVMSWLQQGKLLSKRQFLKLCLRVKSVLEKEDTFQFVNFSRGNAIICGDLHGQFDDLCRIFCQAGLPNSTKEERCFLFNGDFVDRGPKSVEIITCLFAWKIAFPQRFWLNRGNHEFESICSVYGFAKEMSRKYDDEVFGLICREIFPLLPIAHVINETVFVVHGGLIDPGNEHFSDLQWWRQWSRAHFRNTDGQGEVASWLWSDPGPQTGIKRSHRGSGWIWGPDVTEKFCRETEMKLIVRSHEFVPGGVAVAHEGKCVTIFSAPNYMGNGPSTAAYLVLEPPVAAAQQNNNDSKVNVKYEIREIQV